MYATANEYLGIYKFPVSSLVSTNDEPQTFYPTVKCTENFKSTKMPWKPNRDLPDLALRRDLPDLALRRDPPDLGTNVESVENLEKYESNQNLNKDLNQDITEIYSKSKPENKSLNLRWKTEVISTSNPKVWGPAFWFSLHVSAAHYPDNPSDIVKERMKQRILAIPYEVPCSTCRPHASSFIESYRDNLDDIVKNKHTLGKFYVDFHNKVNQRYGKPTWSYQDAFKVYSGQAKVTYLQ